MRSGVAEGAQSSIDCSANFCAGEIFMPGDAAADARNRRSFRFEYARVVYGEYRARIDRIARDDADRIRRRREDRHARRRYRAEGGFEADDTVERRRPQRRAAGLRPEGKWNLLSADRCGASGARTTRRA